MGLSARASALGEAYSTICTGPDAVFWNPANLAFTEDRIASFECTKWFEDVFLGGLSYAQKVGETAGAGLSFTYLHIGRIKETFEDTSGNFKGEGKGFYPKEMYLTIAYGAKVERHIAVGVSGKTFLGSMGIGDRSLSGLSFDLGATFDTYHDFLFPLRVSLVAQNLGGRVGYSEENEDPIPLTYRIGATTLAWNDLVLACDLAFPRDNDPMICLGFEKVLGRLMTFRGGCKYDCGADNGLGRFVGLSCGVGLSFKRIFLDLAVMPYGDLGWTIRTSLKYQF
jgi:hypothetical protein